MEMLTVFPVLDLALAPPRDLVDELERRPRLISARAADRFALPTRAAKPARPFDEEPDLDLLATLANAVCLTRAGELRRTLLDIFTERLWSRMESSSAEEDNGDGLAFRLPFPMEG